MPNLYVALIHHPVKNKNGDVIASAVTNLDLHDISRTAKTYGVKGFYVVTPLEDQQVLAERIVDHWRSGPGARYNPSRAQAFELIEVKASLEQVVDHIRARNGGPPQTVATCARKRGASVGYDCMRGLLNRRESYVLLFGTAWGLAEEVIRSADLVLAPILGATDYNHLPVRSAAAIILDRLLGRTA